uniref:Uncharacterized protein n=1 Tax=Avena sativa TaxID=4498 RepID=A0ACD6AHJ4_AVESA
MSRRERRLGVAYVDSDKDRDITFFKRHFGLFKRAEDLSVVTGARVSVVLESDREKIHSFGTPSAKPIVDAFLSGIPPISPLADEVKASTIARLQSKVAHLDMKSALDGKRKKLSIQRMKEIQDGNIGMEANLVFSKEEDLTLEDLDKLFNELSRIQEDSRRCLPPLHHCHGVKNDGPSMKINMLPLRGLLLDHLHTTPSSLQFSWSHHLMQHEFPSVPLPSPPLEQTMEPLIPMLLPQVRHSAPSSFAPHYSSLQQPIPGMIHDLPTPQDLHLHNYPNPRNTGHQVENYVGPNLTSKYNLEAFPLLSNSSINDMVIDNTFGYDRRDYPMIDQAYYNGFSGMNSSLGYNGANVDQPSMGNGGWGYAPPGSSSSEKDANINVLYGGLI